MNRCKFLLLSIWMSQQVVLPACPGQSDVDHAGLDAALSRLRQYDCVHANARLGQGRTLTREEKLKYVE